MGLGILRGEMHQAFSTTQHLHVVRHLDKSILEIEQPSHDNMVMMPQILFTIVLTTFNKKMAKTISSKDEQRPVMGKVTVTPSLSYVTSYFCSN
jgi:hypothetical protein